VREGRAAVFYTLNTLTGSALRNGAAPERLPAHVLQHALYQKTFGELEVEVTDDLTTRQPVQGRVYQWLLHGPQLCITETASERMEQETLELLPGAPPCGSAKAGLNIVARPHALPACM
jgi:hypothetical protein